MFNIFGLIAAFGVGVFAASIGALPAFIMTGLFSVVGAVAGMCGAADASNILVNYMAFGSFFGPHISFAAGVPAEAFGGLYHVLIFGLAAVGLIFAEMGQSYFGCHHIMIIAAEATVQSYNVMGNIWAALIIGIIFGTISGIICDAETNLINSGTDSHIDGPACAIFIMTFVVNACFPA